MLAHCACHTGAGAPRQSHTAHGGRRGARPATRHTRDGRTGREPLGALAGVLVNFSVEIRGYALGMNDEIRFVDAKSIYCRDAGSATHDARIIGADGGPAPIGPGGPGFIPENKSLVAESARACSCYSS